MNFKFFVFVTLVIFTGGCTSTIPFLNQAETLSGYTYIPVDPFAVKTMPGANCHTVKIVGSKAEYIEQLNNLEYNPLLESFPDNAVRMSIEQFDKSGSVTYGPVGIGAKNESYRITVDYVNSDTTNFSVWISKTAYNLLKGEIDVVDLLAPLKSQYRSESVSYRVLKRDYYDSEEMEGFVEFNIPVYIGIGLRVTANVEVTSGTANISGLGAIGAEAEFNNLQGNLIVQTLGINGKSIAAALPIQSELNRTTASNAIVSVGAIKALLYDKNTVVSPRVVGIYLPFPGGKPLVNAIISEISKEQLEWYRPCKRKKLVLPDESDEAPTETS